MFQAYVYDTGPEKLRARKLSDRKITQQSSAMERFTEILPQNYVTPVQNVLRVTLAALDVGVDGYLLEKTAHTSLALLVHRSLVCTRVVAGER